MEGRESEEQEKEKSLSLETFRSNMESTLELIEIGELCEAPSLDMTLDQADVEDSWFKATMNEKENFLRNVIIELGLLPEQLTGERAKRTFFEEGIRGAPSKDGADVLVFQTKYPMLELHVKRYRDKAVGNHYDLVVIGE